MRGVDADDFIDSMYDGPACVRHKSYVYRFSGLKYHPGRHTFSISVERYRYTEIPFADFMDLVYYYESPNEDDCLDHLAKDILWDGKSFYELEKALTCIDW